MTGTTLAVGRPPWLAAVRWLARGLAVLGAGMLLAFIVGEGVDAMRLAPVEWLGMAGFVAVWVGLLLGWRRELVGGALSLGGLALLYAIEWVVNGRPLEGWVWPLLAVPGTLYLVCAAASQRRRPAAAG